jgi:uncharacterized membrane protein
MVWALIFILTLEADFSNLRVTLFWGCISGIFSALANILLIEAMTYQEAGICSTLYRLNLAVVAVGAFLLFGEPVNFLKLTGIAFAFMAVFFFYRESRKPKAGIHRMAYLGIYLALSAALLRAAMGLSYKYAFILHADRNGVITLNSIFWILGGIIYVYCREQSLNLFERHNVFYGILSGILVSGIIFFMALALQYGNASIVLPIAQMSFLGTCILAAILLRESVTVGKVWGISAGIVSILTLLFA